MTGAMSRRDRAALVLALEVLRGNGCPRDAVNRAREALRFADNVRIIELLWLGIRASGPLAPRPYRARAALLLRALLRASWGDYGWRLSSCHECTGCGARFIMYGSGPAEEIDAAIAHEDACGRRLRLVRTMRPLHERAPRHDGRTPRERRGGA